MRALRRQQFGNAAQWADIDQKRNDETRLPDDEHVHLSGFVLTEVFTPSTAAALVTSLENFPWNSSSKKPDVIEAVTKGRSAAGSGGWTSLGVVRRSGQPFFGPVDPALPVGVIDVSPYLYFLTPSLTAVVATFNLTEAAGDLSQLLRADYHTETLGFSLRVDGRLGQIRARIPWARPARHSGQWSMRYSWEQKRLACESLIAKHETACSDWLAERFPGRFSTEDLSRRPVVRLLLTKEAVPFSDRQRWHDAAGLGFGSDVWRSTDPPGWFIKFGNWPGDRRYAATAAARRRDAVTEHGAGIDDERNTYLNYDFGLYQSGLIARWAMSRLLVLYTDLLAEMRDRSARRRKPSRPVRQGRVLDDFLVGDGLDSSTIAGDVHDFTASLPRFRRSAAEYVEHTYGAPVTAPRPTATEQSARRRRWRFGKRLGRWSADPRPTLRDEPSGTPQRATEVPVELVPALRDLLMQQASRLSQDTELTTGNVRASAELRQAIANTRLQRAIMGLTVLALAVAATSLWIAFHPIRQTEAPAGHPGRGTPSPSAQVRTSPAR